MSKNISSSIWDENNLRIVVPICTSLGEVLTKIGASKHPSQWTYLKRKLVKYNIDFSHFVKQRQLGKALLTNEEVFVILPEGSHRRSGEVLKRHMLLSGIIKKCSTLECSIVDSWLGKPVTLQVDHINGNPMDNRLFNLRLLCPMCHSQTETYNKGCKEKIKNVKYCADNSCSAVIQLRSTYCKKHSSKYTPTQYTSKIVWPSVEELLNRLENTSHSELGRQLGVSDNAIRKHLKRSMM